MTDEPVTAVPPEGWPECGAAQVEVMLLGTYHMDNPDRDEVNVEADDVLSAERQAELAELTDRLFEWSPDRIAVERPYVETDAVNALYAAYRSGDLSPDGEEAVDSRHDRPDESDTERRSEVVQVGFRLADRLDHERIASIDESSEEPDADSFEDRDVDSTRKTAVPLPDPERMRRDAGERLASSTIPEYLAWVNGEDELRKNHALMFDRALRAADERFGSPTALAHWYDRNVRMVHNLWRATEPGDDRLLLVVGSGHVRVLRHLLEEAPMFCPVSPRPYLP